MMAIVSNGVPRRPTWWKLLIIVVLLLISQVFENSEMKELSSILVLSPSSVTDSTSTGSWYDTTGATSSLYTTDERQNYHDSTFQEGLDENETENMRTMYVNGRLRRRNRSKIHNRLTLQQLMHVTQEQDRKDCPTNQQVVRFLPNQQEQQSNKPNLLDATHTSNTTATRIPKIIHQIHLTGNGCSSTLQQQQYKEGNTINSIMDNHTNQWRAALQNDFDFYIHGRYQMERFLLQPDWDYEFPHMKQIIVNCIGNNQGHVDIFKALLLWEYGGGIVDSDWMPTPQNSNHDNTTEGQPTTTFNMTELIRPDDQAILFNTYTIMSMRMEEPIISGNDQYLQQHRDVRYPFSEQFSSSILFMEPHHPLAYYWVMEQLNRLGTHQQLDHVHWPTVTGTHALSRAVLAFAVLDTAPAAFRMRNYRPERRPALLDQISSCPGRYNRTLRLMFEATRHFVEPTPNLRRDWKDFYYNDSSGPLLLDHTIINNENQQERQERWNATCIKRQMDYVNIYQLGMTMHRE